MHIISLKKLREFWQIHPDAENPLRDWHRAVEHATWESFPDVRRMYRSADQVDKFTVFNIGGNKYRLIAVIHYDRKKVYVRRVLTHSDYDAGKWKND
jgi:mRNA interferase HigB